MTTLAVTYHERADLFEMCQDHNHKSEFYVECHLMALPILDPLRYVSPDQASRFPMVLHRAWDRMAKSMVLQPNLSVETVIECELNDLRKQIKEARLTIRALHGKTSRRNRPFSVTQKHKQWRRSYFESLRNSGPLRHWYSHASMLQSRFQLFKAVALTCFPSANIKIAGPEKIESPVGVSFGRGGTWSCSDKMVSGRFGHGTIWSNSTEEGLGPNRTNITAYLAQYGYQSPYTDPNSYLIHNREMISTDIEHWVPANSESSTPSTVFKFDYRIAQHSTRPCPPCIDPFEVDKEFFTANLTGEKSRAVIEHPSSPFELNEEFSALNFTGKPGEPKFQDFQTLAKSLKCHTPPYELDEEFFAVNFLCKQNLGPIEPLKSPLALHEESFTADSIRKQNKTSIELQPTFAGSKRHQLYPSLPGLEDLAQFLKRHNLSFEFDEEICTSDLVGASNLTVEGRKSFVKRSLTFDDSTDKRHSDINGMASGEDARLADSEEVSPEGPDSEVYEEKASIGLVDLEEYKAQAIDNNFSQSQCSLGLQSLQGLPPPYDQV